MTKHTVLVSAKHVSPEFCFDLHVTHVVQREEDGKWYAVAKKLGCSRDYLTADEAVTALYEAHCCTSINIHHES
jgi:hypothetical protein